MIRASTFKLYSILGQVGIWTILLLIFSVEEMDYSDPGVSLAYGLCKTLVWPLAVYPHYYLLLPMLQAGRTWLYLSLTALLLFLTASLSVVVDQIFPFGYDFDLYFWGDVLYYLLLVGLITAVSSLYYFVEVWQSNQERAFKLRQQKLEAELNFLKSQINPHFLFNTLNNIYSYVQMGNAKASEMLERLSSILRFMVYEGSADLVSLQQELEAVENLLEINKMKNSKQANIVLQTKGVKGYHLIAPLIIVNFVENACKHSDAINNPAGFIQVEVQVRAGDLCALKIANSVGAKKSRNNDYGGLGLENMMKRLELQYGSNFQLEQKQVGNSYEVNLELPLARKV
ncbi:MAG: sensor histidine kinase [Saprospiraceae bacterium]|nr:sensor histidine kinase [Saprospiraceae bacterium]